MPLHQASTLSPADVTSAVVSSGTINSVSVPMLLAWWQQRKRMAHVQSLPNATLLKVDETYLKAYHRLMEIYSVVKSGGVNTQTEAVRAFAQRESVLLNQKLQEIETTEALGETEKHQERKKIEQELRELRSANNWRLQALANITPEEEAIVKQYLPDIENTLMHVQHI